MRSIKLLLPILMLAASLNGEARDSRFTREGKAPMYWMAYEQCFTTDRALEQSRYKLNVNWVANNLRDYGYSMVSTDGWIESAQTVDRNGYITKYSSDWSMTLSDMVEYCRERDLDAGIYYNPLWLTGQAYQMNSRITGREDKRARDIAGATPFNGMIHWVDTDRDGAEQWVKGYVRHFINLGFKFLRIDFLNMYENAYGSQRYEKALRWVREEAGDEIWVSIVMPNCWNHASTERANGDMFRISEDVFGGGWDFVSGRRRGVRYDGWANWGNLFDGFLDFSDIPRNEIIMDGDFVRLNTVAEASEKEFWISLLVMAGSPIAVADQFDTAADNLPFYQNRRINALAAEGFSAQPLSRDNANTFSSQTWWGMTADGDCVVGFFNRENNSEPRHFDISLSGKSCANNIRDLWSGETLLSREGRITLKVAPHSCRILRFTPGYKVDNSGVTTPAEEAAALTLSLNGDNLTLSAATALGSIRLLNTAGLTLREEYCPESQSEINVAALGHGLFIVATQAGTQKINL